MKIHQFRNCFLIISLNLLAFSGCGLQSSNKSKLTDDTPSSGGTSESNGPRTNFSVKSEGNLAPMLDAGWWYSGGKINIPSCGDNNRSLPSKTEVGV